LGEDYLWALKVPPISDKCQISDRSSASTTAISLDSLLWPSRNSSPPSSASTSSDSAMMLVEASPAPNLLFAMGYQLPFVEMDFDSENFFRSIQQEYKSQS